MLRRALGLARLFQWLPKRRQRRHVSVSNSRESHGNSGRSPVPQFKSAVVRTADATRAQGGQSGDEKLDFELSDDLAVEQQNASSASTKPAEATVALKGHDRPPTSRAKTNGMTPCEVVRP